jgi:UDP-N-acetylmuramyl pentapeptide phosphotransferase/UDP-N-acetylglucosamine-1-phosphate transferase
MVWAVFLGSILVAYFATKLSLALGLRAGILDFPSLRSSHSDPVPRTGGIALIAGFYLSIAAWYGSASLGLVKHGTIAHDARMILLASTGMAAIGVYDDLRRIGLAGKLALQLLWTLVVVVIGAYFGHSRIAPSGFVPGQLLFYLLAILWLVGFSNVYNFMDGINGMAAGTGALYAGFFSYLAWRQGESELMAACVFLAGSCLGFLIHNFPQARIFLGDTGSLFLGMFFAALAACLAHHNPSASCMGALLLVCSVFLFDGTFTLLRRIKRRENILEAHRTHLYQRLVGAGLTHAESTGIYLCLHFLMGCLALAYLAASQRGRLGILGFASLVLVAFTSCVYRLEHRMGRSKVVGSGKALAS